MLIYFGGREVIQGSLSVGSLVAFNSYLLQLVRPIRMLGMLLGLMQRAVSSGDRVFDILDTQADVRNKPDALELPQAAGQVEFKDVVFGYDNRMSVLDGLNFRAQPGQTIAVLGPTGSGKSTLIHLIPRFYDVDEGQVLIDGHDVRDITIESLRHQVATVAQETFLFSSTIRDNIAYGKPEASLEEVVQAAQAAHVHDFIITLPDQYDTVIGERGVGLSGGQKQRVAIARALLMDARIILLDESTSNVDVETEMRIQQAFARLLKNRTTFVIAQRLSTVRNADWVLVLDRGKIAEQGTHDQLLKTGRIYRQIYDLQFRGQEIEESVAGGAAL